MGIQRKRVNWVLDADIRGFFDNMSHEWTMKFIEHRVADRRMLRLIQKWLKAGVSEDGQWSDTKLGTPQGAVVSPLLANVYLHYVFDLWGEAWRRKVATGDVIVVRYADDLVVVLGYYQYHTVPGNSTQLRIFWRRACRLWRNVLVRRSQRAQVRWGRLFPIWYRWIPQPHILHPYPDARFAATHPR